MSIKSQGAYGAILLSIMFYGNFALAEPGVFNARVKPLEINSYKDVTVTAQAEIGTQGLYISSVRLYQVAKNGAPLKFLSAMYDDGTHGDTTESDTVFAAQFVLSSHTLGDEYCVRISAAYQRSRNRFLSPTICLPIKKASPETIEQVSSLLRESSNLLQIPDILNFLPLVVDSTQDAYRTMLENADSDTIIQIANSLRNATPAVITDDFAEYEASIPRPDGGTDIGSIRLINTSTGWKIKRF